MHSSADELVKNANKRMRLLHAASKLTSKTSDMKTIYTAFIRSKLDHSSVVWHSGLSNKNRKSIERIQKAAVKIILKDKYKNYQDGLKYLNLENLNVRRSKQSLKFAKRCLRNEKVKKLSSSGPDHVQVMSRSSHTHLLLKSQGLDLELTL